MWRADGEAATAQLDELDRANQSSQPGARDEGQLRTVQREACVACCDQVRQEALGSLLAGHIERPHEPDNRDAARGSFDELELESLAGWSARHEGKKIHENAQGNRAPFALHRIFICLNPLCAV